MKIKKIIKKTKQRLRPVRWVKKTLKKKKNQRRLILVILFAIIFLLASIVGLVIGKNRELIDSATENHATMVKALEDINSLKEDIKKTRVELESSASTIKEKDTKNKELEGKIEELTELNRQLKSYGSGIGGGVVRASSNVNTVTGNTYGYGYCTWYVKNMRPDIGSYWGDAKYWYASAQAAGFSTGTEPKAGAIGVNFEGVAGHVVYVESVSGDTIFLSEMNGAAGWNVVGKRTAHKSAFVYIY